MALTAVVLLPFCPVIETSMSTGLRPGFEGGHSWGLVEKLAFVAFVTAWGGLGSLLDSVLGALLQESVVDVRTGKIVEGRGGQKVSYGSICHWNTVVVICANLRRFPSRTPRRKETTELQVEGLKLERHG